MSMASSTSGSGFTVAWTVLSLVAYIFAVSLNAILNIPGISPFNVTIGDLSHKYETGITPSDVTFGIWALIYLWQLVLLIYCMTLLCRKTKDTPLYKIGFLPTSFFVSYTINLIGNPGWIYVFLEEKNVLALIFLVLGVVTLVICLAASCKALTEAGAEMEEKGLIADIWCTRIIVQNGIALYLAWVSCATLINLVVVTKYTYGLLDMSSACYVALVILNIVLIAWCLLENVVYDRQLRYVFGHYIAYIIAFVGIYKKHYNPAVSYSVYELALLVFVSVLAAIKLIVIIYRSVKDPIHYSPRYRSEDKVQFVKVPQ